MSLSRRISLVLFVTAVTVGGLPLGAAGQVFHTVDYTFDFFNPLPDPVAWISEGNISPRAIDGRGLQITDLGTPHSLLFLHAAPEIAEQTNVSTFRALVRTPALADAAVIAWSDDVTGFRLILDDSHRQLVLALGRDPTDVGTPKKRVLVVLGATGVSLIPFPWDNGFHNVYEIRRLVDGNFALSATNSDPASTAAPVMLTIPAAWLPTSTGSAHVRLGNGN